MQRKRMANRGDKQIGTDRRATNVKAMELQRGFNSTATIMQLHRTWGNRAIQRLVSGLGNGRAIIQRNKSVWSTEQQNARHMLQTNGYDPLLNYLCNQYQLQSSVQFHIFSTDDYSKHVKGQVPNGTPYGVCLPSSNPQDSRSTIYIHEKWIDEWINKTDNLGNLIDTIKHESVHAGQQQSPQAATYESDIDMTEFEAYYHEIKELIDAMGSSAPMAAPLPTEAQMVKAYDALEKHFANMNGTVQGNYKSKYDFVIGMKGAVSDFLDQNVDTKDYLNLFKAGYYDAFQALAVVKKNKIDKSHIDEAIKRYEALTTLFGELNKSDKAAMDNAYNDIYNLMTVIRTNEGKILRFSFPKPSMT